MTSLLHGGVYAVFALMAIDALLPVGGELIMLYAGALAGGAIAGQEPVLLGWHPTTGLEAYVVMAAAGTLGYLLGSLIGWEIGRRGGRPLLERHGRRLHLDPANLEGAERWFERFGTWAVFLGRLTPLVRSFISISAACFGARRCPTPRSRWWVRRSGASASPPPGGRWGTATSASTTSRASATTSSSWLPSRRPQRYSCAPGGTGSVNALDLREQRPILPARAVPYCPPVSTGVTRSRSHAVSTRHVTSFSR